MITRPLTVLAVIVLLFMQRVSAQDLVPRRWSHLPMKMNIAGAAVAYTTGDILLDPVLKLEDATVDLGHTEPATSIPLSFWVSQHG